MRVSLLVVCWWDRESEREREKVQLNSWKQLSTFYLCPCRIRLKGENTDSGFRPILFRELVNVLTSCCWHIISIVLSKFQCLWIYFFPFIELRVIDFDHSQSKRETPVKLHSLWPKEVPFISIVLLSTILIMTPVYHDAGLYWWCYPNDTRDRDRETEPKLEPGLFPFNQIDEKPCSLENLIGNIYYS